MLGLPRIYRNLSTSKKSICLPVFNVGVQTNGAPGWGPYLAGNGMLQVTFTTGHSAPSSSFQGIPETNITPQFLEAALRVPCAPEPTVDLPEARRRGCKSERDLFEVQISGPICQPQLEANSKATHCYVQQVATPRLCQAATGCTLGHNCQLQVG